VLASATAATPAAYRAHVDAICAPYTPAVKTYLRQLDAAEKVKTARRTASRSAI